MTKYKRATIENKIIVLIALLLFFSTCGIKTRFSDRDLAWLPYESGDTLIFISSLGNLDTTYIVEKKIWYSPYNPIETDGIYHPQIGEVVYFNPRISNITKKESIVHIYKIDPNKPAKVDFSYYCSYFIAGKDRYVPKDSSIVIQNREYSDIIEISKTDTVWRPAATSLSLKPKILLWSKRYGLVKYITYTNEIWELLYKS